MKNILCIVLLSLLPSLVSARTFFSIGSNWSASNFSYTRGGLSCGVLPAANDSVIIPSPHAVTRSSSLTIGFTGSIGTLVVESGASLSLLSSSNLTVLDGGILILNGTLTAKDVMFSNGSSVTTTLGSTFTVMGNFTNYSNSVTVNGKMNISGSFINQTGGVIKGTTGVIKVSGSVTNKGVVYGGIGCVTSHSEGKEEGGSGELHPCEFIGANNPLPIELINFTAKVNKGVVDIKWTTSSEKNNDYFTIERSLDGINFEKITTIAGRGNSSQISNYSFSDKYAPEGVLYYRLKQTDYDGVFSYSNIVAVEFYNASDFSYSIFPNPTNGVNINIKLNSINGDKILVAIYDLTGKECYSNTIFTADNGEGNYPIEPSQKLSSGMYLLMLTANGNISKKKFIVE